MEDQIFIQHRFTIEKDGLTLQDAIVLPQAEYESLSNKDIEDLKTERFTNFEQVLKNPQPQEEITPEEQLAQVEEQLASIEQQKQSLVAQKAELDIAIAVEMAPINIKPIKGGK